MGRVTIKKLIMVWKHTETETFRVFRVIYTVHTAFLAWRTAAAVRLPEVLELILLVGIVLCYY